jgi:hypothetical protein
MKYFILLLILLTNTIHAGWFTKYQTPEKVPNSWRDVWVSNSYERGIDEVRERFIITENQVTWLTTNAYFVDMPIKSIRIPSGDKIYIEFQYLQNRHFLVPPEDKWHPLYLKEDDLIRVFCPFCDKVHTFSRDRTED